MRSGLQFVLPTRRRCRKNTRFMGQKKIVIPAPSAVPKRTGTAPPDKAERSLDEETIMYGASLLAQDTLEIFQGGGQAFRQRMPGLPAGVAELVCAGAGMFHVPGALRSVEHPGGGAGGLDDVLC